MGKTTKRAEWEHLLPRRCRLPYGYEVEFHVVSQAYVNRLGKRGHIWGVAFDFGEPVPGRKTVPAKTAHIYFSRELTTVGFVDKLQHEMHHTVTEWGGWVFDSVINQKERP